MIPSQPIAPWQPVHILHPYLLSSQWRKIQNLVLTDRYAPLFDRLEQEATYKRQRITLPGESIRLNKIPLDQVS